MYSTIYELHSGEYLLNTKNCLRTENPFTKAVEWHQIGQLEYQ